MFKKFFKVFPRVAAIACALITGVSFAACNGSSTDEGNTHTHSFATTYTQGETQHWYACSGCDEKQCAENHSYTNGVCKCGKADPNAHSHNFANTYTQGETQHWYACSGCDEKQGAENHNYTNGICKCGKADPNAHSHNFANTYTQGETQHWYACSGCDEKQGAENHSYTNGVCECGKADPNAHTEHDFTGAWVKDDNQHWHKCTGCEVTDTKEGHTYSGGVCKCGKADPNAQTKYTFPASVNFGNDVAVHDPSIFKDPKDGTYYAFGTHFAVASSTDLIHWTQRAKDEQYQQLYGNETYTKNGVTWPKALQSTLDRVNPTGGSDPIKTTWAPDVEYHDGKYYMYYSITKAFGSRESAIGRVEADNVMGPYSNNTILFDSIGGSGDNPNCIDPELFYDKDGGLWMVYGSFFGGIYIKELYNSGANWGLPKEEGFGKLLWKGGGSGAEGPYIFRNGDYYYLMVSDGSLMTNYNMRVARSTSPDGPYYDITNANMASTYGGNKLAGNWKFDGETGKAAYGHNSVCEIDGEFFVVAHMRYDNGSGGVTGVHNVRVHRILFNEAGWPVLATERYAGETLGAIEESEIAGNYDLILHSEGNPQNFVSSARYTFKADHTITGAQSGTWSYKPNGNYIEITLNGVTYKGVAMPVWTENGGAIALSAVSDAGRSLWANGVPAPQAPNLDIIKQVEGAANNTVVAAFNAANGFTVSFRSTVAGNAAGDDWNAHALVCRGLEISLPNLRILADNTAGLGSTQQDMYPSKNGNHSVGSGNWNSYLGTTCFVTIAISADGIQFYKNGVCTQSYAKTAVIEGATSVGTFLNAFLEGVTAEGFTFAESGLTANGLIVSSGAADAATAKAIYNYYG